MIAIPTQISPVMAETEHVSGAIPIPLFRGNPAGFCQRNTARACSWQLNPPLAAALHGQATRPSFKKSPQARLPPRSPHFPVHSRLLVQLSCCKLILDQITSQTELLILLILGWIANVDLVVSRVCVDIVVFPISLHECHFIWRERFEMLLPLRSVSDNGSKACSREQILCLGRISSAAQSQGQNCEGADAADSGE
jgi:hypothetical protein